MNMLRAAMVKRHCAFIMKMEDPVQTLKRLLDTISDQGIKLELMQVYSLPNGEARLNIHCLIDKEKIKQVRHCLENKKGIIDLELLENRLTETH